jgi:hypothetical protein
MKQRIPTFNAYINERKEPVSLTDAEIKELIKFGFFKDDMGYGQYAKLEFKREIGSEIIEVYKWEDGKYRINKISGNDDKLMMKNGRYLDNNSWNWSKSGLTWAEVIDLISHDKDILIRSKNKY